MTEYFKKIGIGKFILMFLLSIGLSVALLIPYTMIQMAEGEILMTGSWEIFLSSLGLYLGIMIFIWGLSLTREDRQRILTPAPAHSPKRFGFYLAPFLLALPVNVIYVLFLERFFPSFLERMMEAGNLPENFMSSPDPVSLLLLFLSVVVMAPIVEEIAFRGVLYNLLNKTLPLWVSALISSVIFGILHGTTFLQTAIIGLVLAFIYQITGDLKVAIIGHAVNNAVAFGQAILLSTGVLVEGEPSEMILGGVLLVLGVVMVIASIRYLRHHSLRSIFNDRAPVYKHEIWASRQYQELEGYQE